MGNPHELQIENRGSSRAGLGILGSNRLAVSLETDVDEGKDVLVTDGGFKRSIIFS